MFKLNQKQLEATERLYISIRPQNSKTKTDDEDDYHTERGISSEHNHKSSREITETVGRTRDDILLSQ